MILKEWRKIWKKAICCLKNDKNLANFDPNAQFSKICTVICPFCGKYITFDQKKYKEVIFDDTKSHAKYEEK